MAISFYIWPICSHAHTATTGQNQIYSKTCAKSNTLTYRYHLYQTTGIYMFLRLRLKPLEEERDAYIQTYKVGKKKQELDEFVAKNIRRFSLTGIV